MANYPKALVRLSMALVSVLLLTQCSSVDRPASQPSPAPPPTEPVTSDTPARTTTPQSWLQQATQASGEQQYRALIEAALAFQDQQQWQQSAAVLSQLPIADSQPQRPLLHLAHARWLASQQQWQPAIDALTNIAQQLNDRNRRYQALALLAQSHAKLGQYWHATVSQVEASRYATEQSPDQQQAIWHYLRLTPAAQLSDSRPLNTALAGWWRLANIMHTLHSDHEQRQQALQQWQRSYPQHLAAALVEQWLANPLPALKQLSVLLPLSGPYAEQGIAIRDGLLMATQAQAVELQFIDTHTTTIDQQQAQIISSDSQHIIGPLLKTTVAAWKAQPLPGVWQILLNETAQLDNQVSPPTQVEFALSPEDESRQAADYLASFTQQRPLVLAAQTRNSERLVNAFQQQLAQHAISQAELGWYAARDEMQSVVERKLGVTASAERIREVKIAAGKIIVDEQQRSRADLSAIYLPGNLAQVRLLKPFIDVNLSPFAEPVKVYASSDVHQRSNHQGDADLRGIIFTESPVLIDAQQNAVAQWLTLRSEASLNQARLLAMGYDSFQLLNALTTLVDWPGVSMSGMSGALKLSFGRVHRQLNWATFSRTQVQPIELP